MLKIHTDTIVLLIHARIEFCEEGPPSHVKEYAKEARKLRKTLAAFALQNVSLEQIRETLNNLEN